MAVTTRRAKGGPPDPGGAADILAARVAALEAREAARDAALAAAIRVVWHVAARGSPGWTALRELLVLQLGVPDADRAALEAFLAQHPPGG
jgi:hypothetical protein